MRAHLLILALAGLLPTAAIATETDKAPVRPPERTAPRDVRIAMASVKDAAQQDSAREPETELPAKQRRGRATSCRCGDQNPSD